MAKEAAIFVQAPQETLPVDGRPMVKENAKRRVELDVDVDLISMCIFFQQEKFIPLYLLFSVILIIITKLPLFYQLALLSLVE